MKKGKKADAESRIIHHKNIDKGWPENIEDSAIKFLIKIFEIHISLAKV